MRPDSFEALRRDNERARQRKGNGPADEEMTAPAIGTAMELEMEQFPTLQFVVSNWIVAGLTLLAGKPKQGKSWLILGICDAVARNMPALGTLAVEPGDVLYLALEDTKRRLQQRLRAVRQSEPAPANFYYATTWRKIDQGGLDDLERWLDDHPNARLIAVDTLAQVREKPPRDMPLYQADYQALAPLKALADRRKVAVVVICHLRKATADDPLDEISGSTGLTACADTLMVLKREKGKAEAVLYLRGRDIEEQETALQFDGATGRWTILGDAARFRQSQERQEIMRAIAAMGGPATPREIADTLGKNASTVRNMLWQMQKTGLVMKTGKGKYLLQ